MAVSERITTTLQESLITLLCHDDKNGRLVAHLADPQLFEGDYRVIAERAIDYWNKHKKAPGVHTDDLIADILDDKNNRKAKTFRRILESMVALSPGVNSEYVIGQLNAFTRLQRMKDGILKAAEQLNAQNELALPEVEELLADLLRARTYNLDTGLRLSDINKVLDFLESHYSEFRTGINQLDRRNIVPSRGATMLMLAPAGRGKTWFLIHIGKHGLLQRKKVLHISLEMSAEEVMQRYYQGLFAIPKREGDVKLSELNVSDEGRLRDIARGHVKPDFAFSDKAIRKKLTALLTPAKRVDDKSFSRLVPNLIVKRFPPRSLTANGLRAFIDALEAAEGFIPDMIILDYIGIMHTDPKNPRVSLGRVFEEFRAICVERNAAGVTAHQTNKSSADAELVKATHVAEDWSLIATSDIAVTYSQTPQEEAVGLARLFVAKCRTEEDKFGVIMTQSYALGQFVLQSASLEKRYYDYLDDVSPKRSRRDDDDDDDADDD